MQKREISGCISTKELKAKYGSEYTFQKIKPKKNTCYFDENMEGICFDENLNPRIITRDRREIKKVK